MSGIRSGIASSIRSHRWDIAASTVLALEVAKLTFGIWKVRDLPFDDEGYIYASSGIRLLAAARRGIWMPPTADWAPLHSVYYAIVNLVVTNRTCLFDAAWIALVAMTTFLAYAVARTMSCSPLVALVAAGVLPGLNVFHLPPFSSHLLAAMLLGAVLLASRCRTSHSAYGVLASAAMCGAFFRPETTLVGALGLLLYAGREISKEGAKSLRDMARIALPLLPPVTLFAIFGNPLASARTFTAFSQHYAYGVARRQHLADNPWLNFDRITARDFGDTHSVGVALFRNPKAFAVHVLHNFAEVPGCILDVCTLKENVTRVTGPLLQGVSAVIIVAAVGIVLRSFRGANRKKARSWQLVATVFVGALLAALPGLALVFPRAHYLVVACVFGWLTAIGSIGGFLDRTARHWPRASWVVVATTLLAAVPTGQAATPERLVQREAVVALAPLRLRSSTMMDQAGGLLLFAGYDYPQVNAWTKDEPWPAFVRRHRLGIVLVWKPFLEHQTFGEDPAFLQFLVDPAPLGFREVALNVDGLRLFVRPELLPEPEGSGCPSP